MKTFFVAGCGELVEETIVLKIENFSEFLKLSNEELKENGITFNAGGCRALNNTSGSLATWKYYFEHANEAGEDWVGGFLKFEMDVATYKPPKASHSVSLSSGGKLVTSFSAELEVATSGWGNNKLIRKAELLEKTKGDVLEVTLLIKVFSNNSFKPVQKTPSSNSAAQLKERMTSDLIKMLKSGGGASVDIKVPFEVGEEVDEASYTRKAHKGILMARSSVFATMFAEESEMIEAQKGEVIIPDLSPRGLDIFLHYLYTGEVLQDWMQVVPEILNAAEKYDCGELKQYCGSNISAAVSTSNALEFYKLAKLHGLTDAGKKIGEFISKNTEAVIDQVVEEFK